MAITTPEQILKVLRAFNPWWTTGNVMPALLKKYRRFAYYEAMKRLDQRDIRRTVVLTGARRVGKTTIEYQLIDTLLQRGVAPRPAAHPHALFVEVKTVHAYTSA